MWSTSHPIAKPLPLQTYGEGYRAPSSGRVALLLAAGNHTDLYVNMKDTATWAMKNEPVKSYGFW